MFFRACGKNMLKFILPCPAGRGRNMIKRIISTVATVALILVLGAYLGKWRAENLSLASDRDPAISLGGRER